MSNGNEIYFPTLYKIDSKGKIREWSVRTEDNVVVVTHGVKDGKMQTKETICVGKNNGRANATSPEEQAVLEAKSKWNHQINREDYAESPEESGKQLRPMLANDYRKVPHRVKWVYALAQPKLDGLRLTAGRRWSDVNGHEMMTRKGDSYNVPHLVYPTIELLEIVNKLSNGSCIALDGEAYIHGMSLQNITSLARKYQKGKTEKLKYYMFDLVIKDMPFEKRYKLLCDAYEIYEEIHGKDNPFEVVETEVIGNEEEMIDVHGKYVEQGYEGVIIRHSNSMYDIGKRSANLFKYKQFFDEEALITNVWEDKNGLAMLTVKQKNGMICDVTPKRTHEERASMLEEKDELIGKWITVKFQAFTDEGVFQFPTGLAIREVDENGEPIV